MFLAEFCGENLALRIYVCSLDIAWREELSQRTEVMRENGAIVSNVK